MVETRIRTAVSRTAVSRAGQARFERLELLRRESAQPRVKVLPANDAMRRLLTHPSGVGFRGQGAAEWPLDRFTRRRLKEGAITLAGKEPA